YARQRRSHCAGIAVSQFGGARNGSARGLRAQRTSEGRQRRGFSLRGCQWLSCGGRLMKRRLLQCAPFRQVTFDILSAAQKRAVGVTATMVIGLELFRKDRESTRPEIAKIFPDLAAAEMLMRLPERGEHPAARDPDKAAGNHIAEKMIVGA